MVPLKELWLPVLLSGVFVFVLSSIVHMVLRYHNSNFVGVPDEDGVQGALRPFAIPPGDYALPHADGMAAMKTPEFQDKLNKGPVIFMTVFPNGQMSMGKGLFFWFVYAVVVSLFAAYVAGRALPAGADYMAVFRFTSVTAFAGYVLGQWPNTIWYKRKLSTTLKYTLDGLIYALGTAGVFGWLWP
jgi:hypothetical protein